MLNKVSTQDQLLALFWHRTMETNANENPQKLKNGNKNTMEIKID